MLRPSRAVTPLLILLSLTGYVSANEPVFGPPEMIVDARINDRAPGPGKWLEGTTLDWAETYQSWNREGAFEKGGQSVAASPVLGRSVFILKEKRFVASLNTLQFTRLNGDPIDLSEVENLLRNKRAVVLLPKGAAIHPEIANALHPETVVVTRVSYPTDPLVIGIPEKR